MPVRPVYVRSIPAREAPVDVWEHGCAECSRPIGGSGRVLQRRLRPRDAWTAAEYYCPEHADRADTRARSLDGSLRLAHKIGDPR